jgi:hypothetical protein
MTARRQARARDVAAVATTVGGVPRALAVGRCIEVWAEDPDAVNAPYAAMRRFSTARRWWLEQAGVESVAEGCQLVPLGSPWSVEFLTYRGQAERIGRPVASL